MKLDPHIMFSVVWSALFPIGPVWVMCAVLDKKRFYPRSLHGNPPACALTSDSSHSENMSATVRQGVCYMNIGLRIAVVTIGAIIVALLTFFIPSLPVRFFVCLLSISGLLYVTRKR